MINGLGLVPIDMMTASTGDLEVGTLLLDRAAASGGIRLAKLHLDALDGFDMAVFIPMDGNRIVEQLEDNALLLSVVDLLRSRGKLLHAAAVDNIDILRTEALGATAASIATVAAADDGNRIAVIDGSHILLIIGVHQVGAGEVLVGRITPSRFSPGMFISWAGRRRNR